MKITSLADLYIDQLQDIHNSERQAIKAFPRLITAASNPSLKAAFTAHLAETREHLERLNRIFDDLGKSPGRKVCEATVGILKECADKTDIDDDEEARDAGLIGAAQKLEHYEIATYGCLRTYAMLLGRDVEAKVLERSLEEEKRTDAALSALATSVINAGAMVTA